MALGIRAANPIWYFVDHFGIGLNDQYYIFFLNNIFPYLPQPVFHDVNLTTPWANPLIFFPNGTLPDNMYWPPDQVWRLEIRQGPTQSDPLIYEINNFQPGIAQPSVNNIGIFTSDNLINNPQFSELNFTSPLTITTAGTYNIAPGWNLVLTGAGTITLTQLVYSGVSIGAVIGEPPFGLRLNSNGWTEVLLQQTFNHNGAIFANGAIAGTFAARSNNLNIQPLSMTYNPNAAGPPIDIIPTVLVDNSNLQVRKGAVNVVTSTNPTLSTTAFVNINIHIPGTSVIDITNIQITGQSSPLVTSPLPEDVCPDFVQVTQERELSNKFNIYARSLLNEPKNNILVGWNFPQNPFQFQPKALTLIASQTQYIADQTILHQETAGSVTSGLSNNIINYSLQLRAVNGVPANRIAIIQYIDSSSIASYWGTKLSLMVRALQSTHFVPTASIKARIIYRTVGDAAPTIGAAEPITGWDVNGDVTFAAGWTVLRPLNDPKYLLSLTYDQTLGTFAFPMYSFNGFQLPQGPNAAIPNNIGFGVVIYTTAPISDDVVFPDSIVFNSVSLTENEFAIDATPISSDEVLRQCQFYYEKSYKLADLPGTVTLDNARLHTFPVITGGVNDTLYFQSFHTEYKEVKRAIVNPTFYSTNTGASGNVYYGILNAVGNSFVDSATTNWTFTGQGTDSMIMLMNNNAAVITLGTNPANQGLLFYHYVVDARIGI